jgi:Asp-tRNA(Asn)/Glu-tRNA(Gln) amidotransferase A subunit family amidase
MQPLKSNARNPKNLRARKAFAFHNPHSLAHRFAGARQLYHSSMNQASPVPRTAPTFPEQDEPDTRSPGAAIEVHEAAIADLQAAMIAGSTTSRALVEAYLARIAAYDQHGPAINALVTVNPHSLEIADALDAERRAGSVRGPLHGIPLLVKDNFDTLDMPTSGGALALATLQPTRDAFQVARLRAAGAVILGKTTMHELAAGITNVSSLTGPTRNPYDLRRVPGGSSGGTGAAIAASFAAAGLGTDTSGSIRVPAASQNLVGLRATRGLSSRGGVIPLSSTMDVAGPMARCVHDLAVLLDATVGRDPDDAATLDADAHVPPSYMAALAEHVISGLRIGVLQDLFGWQADEDEVSLIVRQAIWKLEALGAIVVDVQIPNMLGLMHDSNMIPHEFKYDLSAYLARHADTPVASLSKILEFGLHHEQLDAGFRRRDVPGARDEAAYQQALARRTELRHAVDAAMQAHQVDVLVYPTMRKKPVILGEIQSEANSPLSPATGLPALSMPAGFTADGVPVGIDLLGKAYGEQALLNYALHWEQATQPRRAPFSTPPLVDGRAPAPLMGSASIAAASEGGATAVLRYEVDITTGAMRFDMAVDHAEDDAVVAVTLQRWVGEHVGPVQLVLLRAGHQAARGEQVLRSDQLGALVDGSLHVHLYTRRAPLGAGHASLVASR